MWQETASLVYGSARVNGSKMFVSVVLSILFCQTFVFKGSEAFALVSDDNSTTNSRQSRGKFMFIILIKRCFEFFWLPKM